MSHFRTSGVRHDLALAWQVPLMAPLIVGLTLSGLLLAVAPPMLYAAVLVGGLLTLAVLRDPRLGFYLTVASIPMEAAGMVTRLALNTTITITKVLAVLTLLAWVVHLVSGRRQMLWTREINAFALVMVCAALSLIGARELSNGLQGLVRLGSTFVFFVMGVNLMATRRDAYRAMSLLLLTSCLMFGFAVAQHFLPQFTFFQREGWSEGDDWKYGVEQVTIDAGGGRYIARSSGTTLHAVVLSATSASMVPVLVGLATTATTPVGSLAAWAGLGAAIAANVSSVSRTGIVMLVLALVYLLARGLVRVSATLIVVGGIGALMALSLLPANLINRLFMPSAYRAATSESISIRKETNIGALNAMLHNPINGLGVGNMLGIQDYYINPQSDYLRTKGLKNFSTANNTYLQTGMELGVPGLVALMYLFWTLWQANMTARRAFLARGLPGEARMSECLAVTLAIMLAAGFTVDFVQQTFKGFWLLMAVAVVLRRSAVEAPGSGEGVGA